MGVSASFHMEANSGVRGGGGVHARHKALEGDDRQTDTLTIRPLYKDVHLC